MFCSEGAGGGGDCSGSPSVEGVGRFLGLMIWDQLRDYIDFFFSFLLVRFQNERLRVDALEASVGTLSTMGLCWSSYSAQRVCFGVALSLMYPESCFCFPAQQALCPGPRLGSGVQPCPWADLASCMAALRVQAQLGEMNVLRALRLHQLFLQLLVWCLVMLVGLLRLLPFILYLGIPTLAQFRYQVSGKSTCLFCKWLLST